MATSAGVPPPSTNSSRTRWPGDFGAIIETSTSFGGVTVPKRMLKPCANISVLPAVRCGAIDSRYTFGAVVSGTRIMMTSAHPAASATVFTARPVAAAFARDLLSALSPTATSTPLSLRFSAWAWPCEP